jgi:hypothetical protein
VRASCLVPPGIVQRVAPMKRHVRLDDLRQGHMEAYIEYLSRICSCSTSNPPCGGCEQAIDEEQFGKEFSELRARGDTQRKAIYWIIERHHDY